MILSQVRDINPEYDSCYMEGNMDTGVKDNNPVYRSNWMCIKVTYDNPLQCATIWLNTSTLSLFHTLTLSISCTLTLSLLDTFTLSKLLSQTFTRPYVHSSIHSLFYHLTLSLVCTFILSHVYSSTLFLHSCSFIFSHFHFFCTFRLSLFRNISLKPYLNCRLWRCLQISTSFQLGLQIQHLKCVYI